MNRRDLLAGVAAMAACAPDANSQAPAPFPMRRGVNLGNALEAPFEGDWGYRIEAAHLSAIAAAGFDGVRLPVRWNTHMSGANRIDAAFLRRVTEVVSVANASGLIVQLDVHHDDALIANPQRERARFVSLWQEIGEAFAAAPDATLLFELLNEPNGAAWDGALLTDLQAETIGIVRESNPTRLIVVGPGNWQNIDALSRWMAPDARNIAVSVHYYEPHAFTHQNAEWLGAEAPRYDRAWGAASDIRAVGAQIAQAADWGAAQGLAMQLGEFGANARAPLAQRAAWTRAVREACESRAMSWCVWDYAGAFAVWDRERGAFIPEMSAALGLQ